MQLQCKFFLSRLECGWVHAGRGVTGPLLGHHGDSHSFVCSLLISTVGVRRSNQVQQSNIQHKVLIKPDGCGLQCIVRPVRVVQVHPHMLCVFYQTNLTLKLTAVRRALVSSMWVLPTAWEVRLINVLTWLTQSAGLLCSDFYIFFSHVMRFVCSGLVQASPVQFVFFIGGPRDQPAAPSPPGGEDTLREGCHWLARGWGQACHWLSSSHTSRWGGEIIFV